MNPPIPFKPCYKCGAMTNYTQWFSGNMCQRCFDIQKARDKNAIRAKNSP